MSAPPARPQAPAALRQRIARDLRPVAPLPRPWKRALVLLPLGVALLAGVPAWFGLRGDAGVLGNGLLWGLSLAQLLFGLVLVTAALREAVPGRGLGPLAGGALLAAGIALVLAATLATWHRSATVVPPRYWVFYWKVCFGLPAVLGLPALLVTWALAARGLPLRPGLAGALAGMGAGLITDAGWRTYCHVSEPGHVLSSHLLSILALTLVGGLLGWLWGRVGGGARLS